MTEHAELHERMAREKAAEMRERGQVAGAERADRFAEAWGRKASEED